MQLGEILMANGFITVTQIEEAACRQKSEGGRLDDSLIALGFITPEQRDAVLQMMPKAPKTIEETGLPKASLSSLMLKSMYSEKHETIADLVDGMKVPYNIIKQLIDEALDCQFLQALGAVQTTSSGMSETRYTLSERGRKAAQEAFEHCRYTGPAPVSLAAFQEQILKQQITNETMDTTAIRECLGDLVIPRSLQRKIGPAINAGRTILLYGPSGNGKTSIAARIAKIFKEVIYIPHCFEVEGHIIQVFDASIHKSPLAEQPSANLLQQSRSLRRAEFDQRWVASRRPTVVVGGELSLEMLDLSYSETAHFYEAPMHVKALGGTFIIDDFGRQLLSPVELLNRWIVPMESRVDFFKLNNGKSFQVPFDALLIFSTNLAPDDLMDPAFLRRITYKIELREPTREIFHDIFEAAARAVDLDLTDEIFAYVLEQLQVKNDYPLAYYQPKFIIDQVIASCKYEGVPLEFSEQYVSDALTNLYVYIETEELDFEHESAAQLQMSEGTPVPAEVRAA